MTAAALAPCPICRADAAKPRVGALGEPKGVWCTQCGHAVGLGEPWGVSGSARPATITFSSIAPGKQGPLVTVTRDPFGWVAAITYPPSTGSLGAKLVHLIVKPHPHATRDADGSAPKSLIANLHGASLDALARNAMGVSRPQGMTDEDLRVVLTECYNATKPNP